MPRFTIGVFNLLGFSFMPEILESIRVSAEKTGCNLISFTASNKHMQISEDWLQTHCPVHHSHVDGLIFCFPSEECISYARSLAETGFPIVLVARESPGLCAVMPDNRGGMFSMISHLISQGHTRIIFLNGPAGNSSAVQRLAGYRQALESAGIPFEAEYVINGNFAREESYTLLNKAIKSGLKFTAVAGANDFSAMGAMQSLHDNHIQIPSQVAVTGFDDLAQARWTLPPLSTIRMPGFRMGSRAVELLVDQLEKRNPAAFTDFIPSPMVIRKSSTMAQTKGSTLAHSFRANRAELFKRIVEIVSDHAASTILPIFSGHAEKLLKAHDCDQQFLQSFSSVLNQISIMGISPEKGNEVLALLEGNWSEAFAGTPIAGLKESIIPRCAILISEAETCYHGRNHDRTNHFWEYLIAFRVRVTQFVEEEELIEVARRWLKSLHDGFFALLLNEESQEHPVRGRIALWNNPAQDHIIDITQKFNVQDFRIQDCFPADHQRAFTCQPLYAQQDQLGLLFFHLDHPHSDLLFNLASEIASQLKASRLKKARERAEEELFKARKLESLGTLAGGIAHDFNNLLTAILGNISLAELTINPSNEAYSILKQAEKASDRARDLARQFLTFAKGGAPILKTASIGELVPESTRFLLRGSNVKGEFHIAPDLWLSDIDAGQVGQVINNLVQNAKEAMPSGGILEIHCSNQEISGNSAPAILPPGKYIRIEIQDHGHGISPENLCRLFEPYFTTKTTGNGLGLAISHSIITRHGGRIWAESKLNQGTTFKILLPASQRTCIEEEIKAGTLLKGTGRILVLDDEAIVRDVAESILRHGGYRPDSVEDGNKLLEYYLSARQSNDPYRLVILDLTIPGGISGREVLVRLKEFDPQVKAIVSSGYSNDPVIANFKDHGFCGVVPKPYHVETLLRVVHQALS